MINGYVGDKIGVIKGRNDLSFFGGDFYFTGEDIGYHYRLRPQYDACHKRYELEFDLANY